MGFFAEFDAWLTAILSTYIGTNTARIAAAIEPAVVTLGVLYVIVWGFLQLRGQIDEPVGYGVLRILKLALVLGVGLRLWLYGPVLVDTFLQAPRELAALIAGASDPVTTIDEILFNGGEAAEHLIEKGGFFDGDLSYYLAGFFVYLIVGLTAIYTIFLMALARIALSVLLAIGPLFIALLLFDSTKRFFEAWLAQLTNYALISVLSVLTAALMMNLLTVATTQALAAGEGITIAHAARVGLASGLIFLVMRQVMPMSAGLASGLALSSFGLVSHGLSRATHVLTRSSGQFLRGAVLDRDFNRWDSLPRMSGQLMRRSWLDSTQALRSTHLNRIRALSSERRP
ncbi:MAG: hypothetical protein CMLOHMNK_01831 [Steroidobacteraceae bacterium]|nr:hypothetical protein [Steroidobacteraceae bacterium]